MKRTGFWSDLRFKLFRDAVEMLQLRECVLELSICRRHVELMIDREKLGESRHSLVTDTHIEGIRICVLLIALYIQISPDIIL